MNKVNSLSIINAISDLHEPVPASVSNLVEDRRHLLHFLGSPAIKHVYREGNVVVDFVAKNVVFTSNEMAILDMPLDGLYIQLMYDYMGHTLPRLVNILL